MNKKKIVNDPVYGFVTLPFEIIFDLIEHPYFQRLRRIQQLGLSSYVYPGALHTRFNHALGALKLMGDAIQVLRSKDNQITEEEAEAVSIAILLHDIGHGPFSHALEHSIVGGVDHEDLSIMFMEELNRQMKGRLDLAIQVFKGEYHKHFLHQLVSSQLDMDRMDYLTRDSFFTGVHEGVIGYDRLIKMLDVVDDQLVVEEKGIYSVEKFIISRRLMYWQVYLHKTVLSAEMMLVKVLLRAKELGSYGVEIFGTPSLKVFLEQDYSKADFEANPELLKQYALLDDNDLMVAIKIWQNHPDPVLSRLSHGIVNRDLFKIKLQKEDFDEKIVNDLKNRAYEHFGVEYEEVNYLVFNETTSNSAYSLQGIKIKILYKDGTVKHIADASDQLNIQMLSAPVLKYYLCYPKELA